MCNLLIFSVLADLLLWDIGALGLWGFDVKRSLIFLNLYTILADVKASGKKMMSGKKVGPRRRFMEATNTINNNSAMDVYLAFTGGIHYREKILCRGAFQAERYPLNLNRIIPA
jgi:hypothetical protein